MAGNGRGAMAREDKISLLVNDLVFAMLGKPCDADDQLSAFVENATLALSDIYPPLPNKASVLNQIAGLAVKFEVHGFAQLAETLVTEVKKLFDLKEDAYVNTDSPSNMVELLLGLSWKPLEYAQKVALGVIDPDKPVVLPPVEEQFDWPAHLREGNAICPADYSDSDSDAWSQLSDEGDVLALTTEETIESSLDVPQSQESTALPTKQTLVSDVKKPFRYLSDLSSLAVTQFILDPTPTDTDNHEDTAAELNVEEPPKEADPEAEKTRRLLKLAYQAEQRLAEEFEDCDWFAAEKMLAAPELPCIERGMETETHDLPEWQVLRETLWMLRSPTDCRCFARDASGRFKPRSDLTVVDVDAPVLWTFLESHCVYMDMVHEVTQFGDGLDGSLGGLGSKQPPNTYRAYRGALDENVDRFRRDVADVEFRVVQQEEIATLISVMDELTPSFRRLEFVMSLHRRAICDWSSTPNWLSAIRLLSVLYWATTEAPCPQNASIAADLFLKSFQTYAIIIDNLLTLGKCVDFQHEFIVYRADNLDSSMRESWDEGFYVRPVDAALRGTGVRLPSMLADAVAEIVLGCKSVYVVERLGKLCHAQDYQTKCVLYEDLISRLEKEFSRNVKRGEAIADSTGSVDLNAESVLSASAHHTLCDEILTDPYLLLAFRGMLGKRGEAAANDDQDERFVHPCESLKQYTSTETIRYQTVFERVFRELISAKYTILGGLINAVMRDDVRIGKHLKVLRAVFMIEAGDLMAVCYDCLVKKEKDEPYWLYSHYLSSNIEDYFVKSLPGYNNFQVFVDKRFVDDNILEAIDGIELTYKVEWPLSFIVNKPNLELYNSIFRLLLKLKMTLTSLERLRFSDLDPANGNTKRKSDALSRRLSRWYLLRFRLVNAVGGVHGFAMNHVVHTFGPQLDAVVESASDFDLIVQEHSRYLHTLHELCVNPLCNPRLADSFAKLLDLAQCCIDLWPFGRRQSVDGKLTDMEDTYELIHKHINVELREYTPNDSRLHIDGLQALFY